MSELAPLAMAEINAIIRLATEKEKLAAKATAATPAKAGGATVSPSVTGLDKKGAGSADDSSKAVAPPPPPPPPEGTRSTKALPV